MLLKQAFRRFTSKGSGAQAVYLLLAALLFLCLATPLNLVHGFLFAEEGTTYFRYARLARPVQALLAPHQQYLGLFPNALALLVARVLPISWAAVTSAWMVLLAHLWMIYLVIRCERFQQGMRWLAVAAMLLAPGAAAVVVGSTQTQFVFGVSSVIVFLSDPEKDRVSRTLSVAIAGLNGVASCVLTPFFLFRAWRQKSFTAWLQALILALCSAVQLCILVYAKPFSTRSTMAHRSLLLYAETLTSHMVVLPFLTRFIYHPVTLLWRQPFGVALIVGLLGCAGFAALVAIIWPAGPLARALLLLAVFHGICCATGIEGSTRDFLGAGERYFVVSNAAIALGLLLRVQQLRLSPRQSQTGAVYALMALLLLSGAIDYVRFWKLNQSGQVWADEVREWRKDPLHATLTANPDGWNGSRMYITGAPMKLDLPFYLFDSNTKDSVLATLPRRWFGPEPAAAQ